VHSYEDESITMPFSRSKKALASRKLIAVSGKCIFYDVKGRCSDYARWLIFEGAGIVSNATHVLQTSL
jgi:hypothetical protein